VRRRVHHPLLKHVLSAPHDAGAVHLCFAKEGRGASTRIKAVEPTSPYNWNERRSVFTTEPQQLSHHVAGIHLNDASEVLDGHINAVGTQRTVRAIHQTLVVVGINTETCGEDFQSPAKLAQTKEHATQVAVAGDIKRIELRCALQQLFRLLLRSVASSGPIHDNNSRFIQTNQISTHLHQRSLAYADVGQKRQGNHRLGIETQHMQIALSSFREALCVAAKLSQLMDERQGQSTMHAEKTGSIQATAT
jgi:hypothetical protein